MIDCLSVVRRGGDGENGGYSMNLAALLRSQLSARNREIAASANSPHELTAGEVPSVIFGRGENGWHGNFHPTSFRNIGANPAWARRLMKVHTGSRRAWPGDWQWKELDCANSSDALLMNIFCYNRRLKNRALCSVLGVPVDLMPEFGVRPGIQLLNGKTDRTEVDARIGDLWIESKLTETGFQSAPARMVERYRDFGEVFDTGELAGADGIVWHYQLIRGVLAAQATGGSFCLLCDARRPDLIEHWYAVVRAVRDCGLRCRLQLRTWQELNQTLPRGLQKFLQAKYGIA